jgi:hypothetical protein
MMIMKKLYLEDYDIEFSGLSQALIEGRSLCRKLKAILMEPVTALGHWVQRQPPIVDVGFANGCFIQQAFGS